jgi:hypothetical protein
MKQYKSWLFILFALLLVAGSIVPAPANALTVTKTAALAYEVTSIVSDGTYNYLGANNGNIYKQTISGGAVAATPIASVPGRITSLTLNGTTLYVTVADGTIYTVAAASSGINEPLRILDNTASPTAAQSYNSFNLVNAAITVLLPTAVAGMSTCVVDSGTAHDIIVDVQATDNAVLVGSVGAGGVGITNASGSSTGDFVCLVAPVANKWYVERQQGTWASQ